MEFTCRYYFGDKTDWRWFTEGYVCEVTRISGDNRKSQIKTFLGDHAPDKNDDDVIYLECTKKSLNVFPKNLNKKFPNLRFLAIEHCELEKVTRRDLIGLENLECLSMRFNNLKSLPDDLFSDMKNLRRISFYGNKLESLTSKLLTPIERTLEFANFNDNSKGNDWFCVAKQPDLARLKNSIDENCSLPEPVPGNKVEEEFRLLGNHKKMLNEFAIFRATEEFTDFTITFLKKEYKVHKCILASQSSVFKEIFTDVEADATKTFAKIKNFSEAGFDSFLNYFYTGELEDGVDAIEMFEVATVFSVIGLQAVCIPQILLNLDESNALEVFNLGHHHKSEELKKPAFEVIQEMFPDMDGSFIDKPDDVNYIIVATREIDSRLKKK